MYFIIFQTWVFSEPRLCVLSCPVLEPRTARKCEAWSLPLQLSQEHKKAAFSLIFCRNFCEENYNNGQMDVNNIKK